MRSPRVVLVRWTTGCVAVLAAAFIASGCEDLAPHESSADSPRVHGADVVRLFTRPVRPMLDFGRARTVRCGGFQETPGQGGRWDYWRCQVVVGSRTRPVLVAWQLDPNDASTAAVQARDEQSGTRRDNCCIDHPRRATARDVERLFSEPYQPLLDPGDGVLAAGCKPGGSADGLGNPWRCILDLDSSGKTHETVVVSANGGVRAPQVGRGCCVRIRAYDRNAIARNALR